MLGRVVPFEALDQPPGLGRRKGLVERCLAVDIEIVLDQHDGLDVREVAISQILQDVSIVYGSVAVRHLDVAPAFERREQHEQVGGAVALVLVIDAGWASSFHWDRHARLGNELL